MRWELLWTDDFVNTLSLASTDVQAAVRDGVFEIFDKCLRVTSPSHPDWLPDVNGRTISFWSRSPVFHANFVLGIARIDEPAQVLMQVTGLAIIELR